MNRSRPTVLDVARLAGVSPMTVSRVARGKPGVSPASVEAVNRAMEALQYQPNLAARSMRTGRTGRVGLIVPDITNSNNATMAQAVERRLAREDMHLMLWFTDFDPAMELNILKRLSTDLVDAALLALTDETAEGLLAVLQALPVPAVLIDRETAHPMDAVISDHAVAMRQIVTQLVALGHRTIALIAPPPGIRPARERIRAFRECLRDLGNPEPQGIVVAEGQSIDCGYQATVRLMALSPRPTAIIAAANQIMLGAYKALIDLKLQPPEDLSFVGTDDAFAASIMTPAATVIWRDMAEVGTAAAEIVLERLAGRGGDGPVRRTLPSKIEIRSSIGPVRPA